MTSYNPNCGHLECAGLTACIAPKQYSATVISVGPVAAAPVTDAGLDPYRDLNEHIRQQRNGTHLFDEGCYFCRADAALSRQAEKETA